MVQHFDTKRRQFLRNSAVTIPLVSLSQAPLAKALNQPQPAIDLNQYAPIFFSTTEWKTLLAACDLLIPPGDGGPGALEANVPVFIDRQMAGNYGRAANWYTKGPFYPDSTPLFGYQGGTLPRDYLRSGLAALNHYAEDQYHNDFVHLNASQQTDVLEAAEDNRIPMPAGQYSAQFFSFLWENTKDGYFADPIHGGNKQMMAWKMIGFTGARGSFLDWADQYDRPYPLGPVSIDGERG